MKTAFFHSLSQSKRTDVLRGIGHHGNFVSNQQEIVANRYQLQNLSIILQLSQQAYYQMAKKFQTCANTEQDRLNLGNDGHSREHCSA